MQLRQMVELADEADTEGEVRNVTRPVGPLRGQVEDLSFLEDTLEDPLRAPPLPEKLARVSALEIILALGGGAAGSDDPSLLI